MARIQLTAAWAAMMVCCAPAFAAEANTGKTTFQEQCDLCHSAQPNDGGGAQGPNLNWVFGCRAASNSSVHLHPRIDRLRSDLGCCYARPLSELTGQRRSRLSDGRGRTGQDDRDNLIVYFQAVKEGTFKAAPTVEPTMSSAELTDFLTGVGCHASQEQAERLWKSLKDSQGPPDSAGLRSITLQ